MNARCARLLPLAAAAMFVLPASASTLVYQVVLNGASEAPAVSTFAGGAAVITIDDVLRTMTVDLNFAGLRGTTTAAHIHCCTAVSGVSSPQLFDPAVASAAGTAGVATQTPSFSGFPGGVSFGTFLQTYDMNLAGSWNAAYITANGGSTTSAFNAFVAGANAGKAYFNVHTSFAGGGEIRGFLTPISPVPEPASLGMMLAGLGAVGFFMRRRRVG